MLTAALHPTTSILAFVDDSHCHDDDVDECVDATEDLRLLALQYAGLSSHDGKGAIYSEHADLSCVPSAWHGSTAAGGIRLSGIKILGGYLTHDAAWADARLNDRLTVESQNVLGLAYLRDSANTHNASQAKLGLIKWCANTKPVYWLRLHLPSRVRQSCINHDSRIRTALQDLVNFTAADAVEIRNAVSQAALPSDGMGGLSLTSTLASSAAHALGAWGSALPRIKSLFPRLRDVSLESPLPAMVELKACLDSMHSAHAHARDRYLAWSADHYDFSTTGAKTTRFHPPGLPKRLAAARDFTDPDTKISRATHTFAAVANHDAWLRLYDAKAADTSVPGILSTTKFLSECQPVAGDFVEALPVDRCFSMRSDDHRIQLQRRLRVPLFPPPSGDHDKYGDSLQNQGEHTVRHDAAKRVLAEMAARTYGADNVLVDPRDGSSASFSPGKVPDVTVFDKSPEGLHIVVDTKVVSEIIASTPACDLPRGACVAFANTGERMSEQVHGRPLIDRPAGAMHRFSRTNNTGHRLAVPADYAGAAAQGHEIIAAVFEVSGAASPAVVEFTGRMARAHANKLPLDLAGRSWTATTFTRYFRQRFSVAIRKACAHEIKRGLRSAKGAPKSSAHLKGVGRKGSASAPSPVVQMAVIGVAGLP